MSINVTGKDFLKAMLQEPGLVTSLIKAFPLSFDDSYVTYDGEWLITAATGGVYPGITISHSVTRDLSLIAYAKAKVDTDSSCYFFFFEPYKGDYANYQGIDNRDGAQKKCRSRDGGAETTTNIADDWTVETTFGIKHETDDTDIYFYLDGAEVAHHTTNISSQPFEICATEPNGAVRTMYLRYPPGIYLFM